jgi:hypothetical protein
MQELKHSLIELPDDPSHVDWKNEALLFYHYMLKLEDEYENKITNFFKEARNIFLNYKEISVSEQRKLYDKLKSELLNIKNKDNKFPRAISYIVLISKVINKLESELAKILYGTVAIKEDVILHPEHEEFLVSQLDRLKELADKCFQKAMNESIRIVRTEAWRYVNERRLEEFIQKGYKFKTTYPIKDDRTGEDSWFYYDIHQVKPINEPFSYVWEGVQRTFMTPPDRPNDRNILIPALDYNPIQ